MDPITSAFNLANSVLTLATKVWDATPLAIQQQNATVWGTFTHNLGDVIVALQKKIDAIVVPSAPK